MLLLISRHPVACARSVRESCLDDVHQNLRRRTMAPLPGGTVTFLFTDIEGSTALWERDRQAMAAAVDRHFALLGEAVAAQDGVLFKTIGDAAQAAFPTVPNAIAAAISAQ